MMISRALQYPFQGNGWFKRILVLALVQLIPIVGQLVLLRYGLDIVRAIYAGQTDLPPMHWMSALRDGAKVAFAGLLYLMPFLMAGPLLSSGGSASTLRWGQITNPSVIWGLRGVPVVVLKSSQDWVRNDFEMDWMSH